MTERLDYGRLLADLERDEKLRRWGKRVVMVCIIGIYVLAAMAAWWVAWR